ncbi:centrosome and spindle pole-associated protein 1-like isoform X2 [Girardinichthys multiradiatus]|uniref:centrosome and spindle pole-associated protein 1-like isoform X2 n=1 Tax=Girardinichthys multiradiatus TaxID=208333 RepID=UPI001FAD49B4|nr:centrosome and spindle pole-associated protein 1-like isoform X2 [Girardinichthys multiradiatus]
MPPSASAAQEITQHFDRDSGLTALGRDYEKKKQKLLLELQLEYKDYVAKKNDCKTRVHDGQHQGLSLPIEEKLSTKERLREERQKECNLFLQEQAQNRKIKRGTPPVPSKPELQASAATSSGPALSFLNTQTSTPPGFKESSESRRNAATLTKAGNNGRTPDTWRHGPQRRRRWQIDQPKKTHSSEEELNTDEEEDFDFRGRRRQDRITYEQEYNEESGTPERRGRSISQTPQNTEKAARPTLVTNKEEKEFATGLMIGAAEERRVTQMKKEQYRQELLRQIAEQQENKIKEKKTLLKVGTTEAIAPGKEFGSASQQPESFKRDVFDTMGFDPKHNDPVESQQHRTLGQNSLVCFSPAVNQLPGSTLPLSGMGTVQVVPPFDYYSGFTGIQGQVAFPWVPVVPPVPHTVSNADMSRYDAAFYQGGTRRQDPHSNRNLNRMLGGAQQKETYETPLPMSPPVRANNGSPLDIEGLHADGSRLRNERPQSYREALRQQVTEKEECTRKEKEEKKRRDASELEAEVVYDPWGKGGGGAPIKDKHGNLFSDLYHMHRINNRMTSLRAEAGAPISQQESSHQSPLQQDRYKEELEQQMEEKKRKQAEERERLKILEEKEAKRLATERAHIQQRYEDEQRREKEIRNKHKRSNQAETRDTKEDISKGQKIQSSRRNERGPTPPVPALQRKHTNVVTSRPSSIVSPLKSKTERIVSAPNTQPVPESKPLAPAGQQEVIRELSALRNLLRTEQRKLELQLDQTETHRSHLSKH